MIKNLKLKLLISMFLLVTVFSVTSSCFAFSVEEYTYKDFSIKMDKTNKTLYVLNNVSNKSVTYDISYGLDNYSNYYFQVNNNIQYPSLYSEYYNFGLVFSNSFSWKSNTYNNITTYSYCSANSYCYYFDFRNNEYSLPWGETCGFAETASNCASRGDNQLQLDSDYNYKYSDTQILTSSDVINKPDGSLLYQSIPSFNYDIVGVSRNELRLTVNNFASDYNVYGYTSDVNYSVGDTLDVSSNTSSLRLFKAYSNEVDFFCIIRPTEKIYYYIVDSNNKVVSTGVISELSSGYFLYGFPVDDGVDFVFLLDGKEYWNNTFSFKYTIEGDSNEYLSNDIVNLGTYSRIPVSNNVASRNFTGKVYNNNNEVIATATAVATNDLSSFTCDFSTRYSEDDYAFGHAQSGIFTLSNFIFNGYNSNGSQTDFSQYYIKWSLPSSLNIDYIKINDIDYSTRSGTLTNCTEAGFLLCNLSIKVPIRDVNLVGFVTSLYTPFNISYDVYNGNNELIYSGKINSNDIVTNQINSVSDNVEKPDYEITKDENYTPGNGSGLDVDNIKNWKIEDYKKFIGTDNFIWTFFKAILGNLPWWITTPLTILIFGVVIITLLRLIRGA